MTKDGATKTDGELVEAFVKLHDETAFEELIARHNNLVYRTCLRILQDKHETEDACQAVFLILAQKAGNLSLGDLTGWLYRVARLTATNAVRCRMRRAQRETKYMNDETLLNDSGCDEMQSAAVLNVLDVELAAMPGKNREAVILRYLRGFSQEDAAQKAGCSSSALSVRACRGIEQLRQRLAGRGTVVTSLALTGLLNAEAHAATPATLTPSILVAVKAMTAKGMTNGSISNSVMTMTKGGMKMMVWSQVKTVAATVLAVGVLGGGVAVAASAALKMKTADGKKTGNEWPQWRGPNRDGVAPSSPKLADSWPNEGPKLLWKSDPIPCGQWGLDGGVGSPVVAGGKVFIYVDWRRQQPGPYVISTEQLKELGWEEGVPDDMVKKIEEARLSEKRKALKAGAELDAYIKDFIATLDPGLAKKLGPHITQRLTRGAEMEKGVWPFPWNELEALSKIRDKEFPTVEALISAGGHTLEHWHGCSGRAADKLRDSLETKAYTHTDTIVCLDAVTGKEIWKKGFPGTPGLNLNGFRGAACTPAISGDKCYVTGTSGFYCLAVKDGSVIWQAKLKGGSNSSPLILNEAVFVLLNIEGLTAYNANNGQVLWSQPEVCGTCGSPVSWACGGKDYLLVNSGVKSASQSLCVESATGKVLWKTLCGEPPYQDAYSTPVVIGDTMVLLGPCCKLSGYKMTTQNVEKIWTCDTGNLRGASPLVYRESVYHVHGNTIGCCDLKTGAVKWNNSASWQWGNESSTPAEADGKIIANVEYKKTIMFRATPEKFEQLGLFESNYGDTSSPAIADGKLYLRLTDCLACYELTGK